MNRSEPPGGLPPEFLHIWHVVRRADEQASSRQALARRLGVATLTLQRILVTGDVPSFQGTTSTRILHAWVRTISRLAVHFGHVPRDWIERIGIRWTPRIEDVSNSALKKRESRMMETGRRSDRLRPAEKYRVGVVERSPFNLPLPSLRGSFLENYLRRLLGAVDRSSRVESRSAPESEVLSELGSGASNLQLGLGLLPAVERRGRGVDFLPIPGLRVKLDAVCVRPAGGGGAALAWEDAIAPECTGCSFLVLEDHVACGFLLSQCDLPRERLIVRAASSPKQLAAALARETDRRPERMVVLVAEEEICRETIEHLSQTRLAGVRRLEGAAAALPAYPLCLAWRSDDAVLGELLGAAQNQELFLRASRQTAGLYAELVATALRHGISGWRLHDFDAAAAEFRTAFCLHLAASLMKLGSDDLQSAERFIPEDWRPMFRGVLDGSPPPPPLAVPAQHVHPVPLVYCRSCSALLSDGIHGGVSDRYCRFCADEEGRLKPRNEVEDLLTLWIQQWQGGLTDEQARRRAALFMQSMPAWNEN